MGLLFERHDEAYSLAIWKVIEPFPKLCAMLDILPEKLPAKTTTRQRDWLATRILLKLLFPGGAPSLEYDSNGKPHLAGDDRAISISHTGDCVGVLLTSRPSCGIDLEHLHPRIEKLAGRFLSDEEAHVREHDKLEALYVAWGAKEVLYKIYGKGNLVFREHLRVEPFFLSGQGMVTAFVKKDEWTRYYPVEYFFLGELVVTFALA